MAGHRQGDIREEGPVIDQRVERDPHAGADRTAAVGSGPVNQADFTGRAQINYQTRKRIFLNRSHGSGDKVRSQLARDIRADVQSRLQPRPNHQWAAAGQAPERSCDRLRKIGDNTADNRRARLRTCAIKRKNTPDLHSVLIGCTGPVRRQTGDEAQLLPLIDAEGNIGIPNINGN